MAHLSTTAAAGELLFVSGRLAFGSDGRVGGTVAEQTQACLAQIADALRGAGLGLNDVVKTTVWLTEAGDFLAFDAAYAEAFGRHAPARSTVVAALVVPEARVEIEAIARFRQSGEAASRHDMPAGGSER